MSYPIQTPTARGLRLPVIFRGGDDRITETAGDLLVERWKPVNRVHAALLRRIDGCARRRHEAALASGRPAVSMEEWKRERDRGDKLRRALISYLSGPA